MNIDRETAEAFVKKLQILDDKEYFASIVNYNLAPVIGSTKPACLLSFTRYNRDLYSLWDKYSYILDKFHVITYEMKRTEDSIAILFYNPSRVYRFINEKQNSDFLRKLGYGSGYDLLWYFEILKKRFKNTCPHEIAIFLGIPVEDVIGFTENHGKGYIFCGYWKVYSSPRTAKNTFAAYDKAKIDILNKIISAENL